jgi:trigger factor
VQTSVTELPESRVRIDVAVEPAEVGKRIDRAATALAGEMKMPGFRKGKVPPQMVIQRLGREAVLQQALRDSLPEWYERALLDSGVTALGSPKLDVADVPEGEDAALNFTIEIAVRPQAELGEYRGLEVGRAEPDVPGDAIDAELERLRDGFSSLEPVERAAAEGDVVVADYAGTIDGESFEGSDATDHAIELGSEGLLPEFEAGLAGAEAGDERTIEITFPDDHRPEELAGKTASFAVTVKEVREKIAPELDDDFASDASEFETLAELRDSISERIAEALRSRAEEEYRSAAIDAAASNATLELPEEIVRSRAEDGWERLEHSLGHRGIDPETYLKMQGKTREEAIADAMPSAERALRQEATLAAIADAEGIEPSDEDLVEALGPGEGEEDPRKLLARLKETGRDSVLREEVRLRKAADLVVDAAKPIPLEQAEAREKIWTPEKEQQEGGAPGQVDEPAAAPGKLWTPGD